MHGLAYRPTWRLFCAQVQQRWRLQTLAWWAGLLLLVVAAQVAFTVLVFPPVGTARPLRESLLMRVLRSLGLYSPLGLLWHRWPSAPPMLRQAMLTSALSALSNTAERFLLPASAGKAFGGWSHPHPTRAPGTNHPWQVFLGAGAAALFPFALLMGMALLGIAWASSAQAPSWPIVDGARAPHQATATPELLLLLALTIVRFVLVSAVLLSVAALCSSTRTAVAACYATQILFLPIATYLVLGVAGDLLSQEVIVNWRLHASQVASSAVALVALIVLLPESLKAIERKTQGAQGADEEDLVACAASEGVRLRSVEPGSLAEQAGLLPGDIIIRMDDHPIRNREDLLREMAECASRGKCRLLVVRDNASVTLEIHWNPNTV